MFAGIRLGGLSKPGVTGGSEGVTPAAGPLRRLRLAIRTLSRSSEEPAHRFHHTRRLVLSLDLDRDGHDDLNTAADLFRLRECRRCPHPASNRDRLRKSDLVGAVVDPHRCAIDSHDLREELIGDGKREIAVGDRRPERSVGGRNRIHMDPLMVPRRQRELIDSILLDPDPPAPTQVAPDRGKELAWDANTVDISNAIRLVVTTTPLVGEPPQSDCASIATAGDRWHSRLLPVADYPHVELTANWRRRCQQAEERGRSSLHSWPTWASPSRSSLRSSSPELLRCLRRRFTRAPTPATRHYSSSAGRLSKRDATPTHPFGFGRERYFWSFVVALVLFSVGSMFALYEGISKIRHPHPIDSPAWAFGVLIFALALEGFSFRTAITESNQVRGDASWPRFIRRSRIPELPVVLLEDFGALVGLLLALGALTIAVGFDAPIWDGFGTLSIGISSV